MKRKIVFIISTIVLLISLVLLIASYIVVGNPSKMRMDFSSNIQYLSLAGDNNDVAFISVENGNEYYLTLLDEKGNKKWSKGISSYCTLLRTIEDYIVVGEGRNIVVYNLKGDLLYSIAVDYNPVDVVIKDEIIAIASSASKIKNRISTYEVDGENRVTLNGTLNINNNVIQLSIYDRNVYFGTGSKIYKLIKDNDTYKTQELAVTRNNFFGFYISKTGTVYTSSDIGTIEIQKKNNEKYSIVDIVEFGSSGSLISYNKDGIISTFDYLGNTLLYDTVQEKSIVKFETETSSSFLSINNECNVAVFRQDKGVYFYDNSNIKAYAFFQDGKVWFVILTIFFAIIELIIVLLSFEKTKEKVVHVKNELFKSKLCYLYLLPAFALLIVFNFYPIISGFSLAFQDYFPGVRADFIGFDNFKAVFNDSTFWSGIGNMFIFLGADLFKAVICSLVVAEIIISVKSQRSQYFARFLMYLPGILPGVASWIIWQEGILGADGIISQIMGKVGVGRFTNFNFLGDAQTAKWALIFIGFPWTGSYLIVYGALKSVPDSIYDAAKLDGFSWIGRIVFIDIPMISAQLKYLFIVNFISSIQNFSRVFITTNGAFDTQIPALSLYQQITTHQNYGVAAAMGVLLFFFIFGFSILNLKSKLQED